MYKKHAVENVYSPIKTVVYEPEVEYRELCVMCDNPDDLIEFGESLAHKRCLIEAGCMKRCECWITEWCDSCSGFDDYQQNK